MLTDIEYSLNGKMKGNPRPNQIGKSQSLSVDAKKNEMNAEIK